MREIVSIQVGSCGNKVGERFWKTISDEHNINPCGYFYGNSILPYQRLNVYYEAGAKNNFVPRVVLCDLEGTTLNQIRCSAVGRLFSPDSFVTGQCGAGNNWARGYYTEGAELMDCILNVTRQSVEKCDCLQGFQMTHSIGGGCGSGMGSLLLKNLKEEYCDRIVNTFTVIPSAKVSETVVEAYNAILSLNEMISHTDEVFCFDNEAMFDICKCTLKLCRPTTGDLNHLVSMTIAGVTSCFRFPGQLNTDFKKILTNMCPYPRLHFFVPGFAPLRTRSSESYKKITTCDLVSQVFDSGCQMAACDPRAGRYLTCAMILRGLTSSRDVEKQLQCVQEKNPEWFVNWIPNNIKTAICDIPPRGMDLSATFFSNTTAIQFLFQRLLCQFQAMYQKKAFVHWYTGEGMDQEEFCEAELAVQSLIDEYCNCTEQDDDEEECEGDEIACAENSCESLAQDCNASDFDDDCEEN